MAHIVINNSCSLDCYYCNAKDFMKTEKCEMDFNSFKKAVDFITTNTGSFGIAGGEPLMHPEFKNFLKFCLSNKKVSEVAILTNGLLIDKYIDMFDNDKIVFLINFNFKENIGTDNYDKLLHNIDLLEKKCNSRNISYGLNLYDKCLNLDDIIGVLKKYNKQNLFRFTICSPNTDFTYNNFEYFDNIKPKLMDLLHRIKDETHVMPVFDCNNMPSCMFNDEEKNFLKSFWERESTTSVYCNLIDNPNCCPIINILPDLTAIRCFALYNYDRPKISDFNNIKELAGYFLNKVDAYSYIVPAHDHCLGCHQKECSICQGGCLLFKMDKIVKIRNILCEKIKNHSLI